MYCRNAKCSNLAPCELHGTGEAIPHTTPDTKTEDAESPFPPFLVLASQRADTPAFQGTGLVLDSLDAVVEFSGEMRAQSLELEKYLLTIDLGELTERTTVHCQRITRFRSRCESLVAKLTPAAHLLRKALSIYETQKGREAFDKAIDLLSPEHVDNPVGVLVEEGGKLIEETILLLPLLRAKVTTWKDRLKAIFGEMVQSSGKLCWKIGLALGTALALGVAIPVGGIVVGAVGLAALGGKPLYDLARAYSKMTENSKQIAQLGELLAEQHEVIKQLGSCLQKIQMNAATIRKLCWFEINTPEDRAEMRQLLNQLLSSLEQLFIVGSNLPTLARTVN